MACTFIDVLIYTFEMVMNNTQLASSDSKLKASYPTIAVIIFVP